MSLSALEQYLRIYHRRELADVTPTETPGYWRLIRPCGGRDGRCCEPIHSTLGNEGPMHHTICYCDSRRNRFGQWVSPYRTWKEARSV